MWEHEGMPIVAEHLDSIWEDPTNRLGIMFYDNACKLRRYCLGWYS